MKTLNFYSTVLLFFLSCSVFAQVQIDKSIQLTGTGTDAKINGIRSATNSLDVTSVQSVQSGSFIYADATGSSNNFNVNLSPPVSAYQKGLFFNFISNQNVIGPATLNVNSLGAKTIKKSVNHDIGQCDIQNGQMVTVVYDGADFQMTSVTVAAAPTVAYAGPNQSDTGVTTTTLAANTPSVGTGGWTIASGTGGSLSNATSPTSAFSGVAGNTYILTWTISACGSSSASSDTVTFVSLDPATISGLYLWYDAADVSTFTYSSGNSVSVWADKSVNHFNASNGTTSEQPLLVANDINGHPAVRFSSSNETYLVNSVFTMNLANRSVFVVVDNTDANVCSSGIISIRGSGNDYQTNDGYILQNILGSSDVAITNLYPAYSISLVTSSPVQCEIPLGIYTDIASSGAGTGYVNGVPGGTGNNPNAATSLGGIILGARYLNGGAPYLGGWQLDGDIAEIIIYDRALNTTERDYVGAYLSAKWGISFAP